MRIGIFTDSYLPRLDGIAIASDTLRRGLEAAGHEVFVICPARPEAKQLYKRDKHIIALRSLPGFYEGFRNVLPLPVNGRLSELELDLIHVETPLQVGLLGLKFAQKNDLPLVATCNADPHIAAAYPVVAVACMGILATIRRWRRSETPVAEADKQLFKKARFHNLSWRKGVTQAVVNYFHIQCNGVIVPSPKLQQALSDNPYGYSSSVIPTGVDAFTPTASKAAMRKQYRLPAQAVVFIMVGRLVKEKNHTLALEAFAEADLPEAHFLIVGGGPEAKNIRSLVKELSLEGRVHLTGKVSRESARNAMAAADVFVSVLEMEAQGLVINEAAHAGLPLLVCGQDINNCVIPNKTALVPSGSAASIAKAMRSLATEDDLRARLGEVAQKEAAKHTIAEQATETLAFYTKAIEATV